MMESVSDILTHFIFNVNNKLNINEDACSVNLSSYMNPKVQNGPERTRTDQNGCDLVGRGADRSRVWVLSGSSCSCISCSVCLLLLSSSKVEQNEVISGSGSCLTQCQFAAQRCHRSD